MEEKFKKITEMINSKKSIQVFIVILVISIILVLYFSTLPNIQGNEKTQEGTATGNTAQSEEQRLSSILSNINGAGTVDVMITYASTPEKVPAINNNTQESSTDEKSTNNTRSQSTLNTTQNPMTVQGSNGTEPLILTEKQPLVRGVIVIAQGGDDFQVRMNITKAICTALNIPAQNVDVFTMKN